MEERIFCSSSPSDTQNRSTSHAPRPNDKAKKNKINFIEKKNNTINSLNEVECFLNDLKHFKRYIHLYKFFK